MRSHEAVSDAASPRQSRHGAETDDTGCTAMLATCADGVLVVDRIDHRIVHANPAARSMLAGGAALEGADFGLPVDGSEVDIVAGGASHVAELRVSDVDFQGRPAWLVMLRDVTDRVEALQEVRDERQALDHALAAGRTARRRQADLIGELDHRVKNTLAIVQSVARRTLREHVDPSVRKTFEGRLGAIARAHDLLARDNWGAVALGDVARRALEPFDGQAIHMDGPVVPVEPKAAVTFAMALYELAVNAAEHGALSVPEGRVALEWTAEGEPPMLDMTWRETGGPAVGEPGRRGFGTLLLQRSLPAELGGRAHLRFESGGLIYLIHAPVRGGASGGE